VPSSGQVRLVSQICLPVQQISGSLPSTKQIRLSFLKKKLRLSYIHEFSLGCTIKSKVVFDYKK
jgi:hypothetical protein